MASTLRILPEIETKSLVCEGIIAVREAVALTVVMPPGSMESGDDIHVRIRGKLGDVAKFPFDDEDEWTATPDDAGNTVLTATLNCNTDALIKSFRFIPENGKMTFLVAVENDTQNCLVARGRVTVMNWIGDGDMQDPVTIESELAEIAELKRLVETKVIDSVEQSGGRIIFTFGDGSTWESDDLTGPPGPAGVSMSDIREAFADVPTTYSSQRAIGTALGRVVKTLQEFGLCLVAFLALAASATEWQDVPATTVIGEGLTVTNGEIRAAGGGGGLSTNDVRAIIEADTGPTNRLLHTDSNGALKMADGDSAFPVILSGAAGGGGTGGLKWDTPSFEGYFAPEAGYVWTWLMKNKKFVLPISKGGTEANPAEIAVMEDLAGFAARTNLPPLTASSTVGDLVDAYNAIANALKKED